MWFPLSVCISSLISYQILHSQIVHFLPGLKLHHLVVFSSESNSTVRYVVDFSPLQPGSPSTLLKLALARNVPAETRLRRIPFRPNSTEEEFIETWHAMNPADPIQSREVSESVYRSVQDESLKLLLDSVFPWKSTMNLYTQNCQHFSGFVAKQIQNSSCLPSPKL